ncbi:SMI1/KNR4 family protein [Nonomuraea sp. NPDC000554]|uniref:SMI1/KNR4 family protein n=1 Tax=Nonomuraea sp. NPDC000554 TaxID=3154259 RepID=UPI003322D4A1
MTVDRESELTGVLRTMAEKVAAGAPAGWRRAEVRGYATGPDGSGHRGLTFEPSGHGGGDIDLHPEMTAVYTLTGATSGHLTIELVVEARGRFEAVISESLEATGEHGFLYVLDRDAVPAEPAEFQQGPSAAVPAGDPREAVALLGAYLRERDRILGGPGRDRYAPPPAIPEAHRTWLETQLWRRYGVALPDDLRALYALIDGDGGEGLLDRHPWFSLELLESQSRPENRWWSGFSWRHHLLQPLVADVGPPLAIRRASDHPCWIPFATSTGGDFLAVDMAPGPGGRPGQVIRIGRNHDDGPVYVADSVTSLLRRHVDALRAGSYLAEQGELWIDLGDMEEPDRYAHEESRSLTVAGPDAAPVRGMHPQVQHLRVSNAPWVDFGPVRGAPMLWRVTMENCPGADLTPLRDTPVELLDLAMDAIDLAPLEGHPTLRLLALRTEHPVDLTPLLSCPRLYALDLSRAAVPDLGVLSELNGLLYLCLRRGQWEELWQRAGHPAGLAAAGLAPEPRREKAWWWSADRAYHAQEPSLRQAVRWGIELAGEAADVRVLRGRFRRR